MGTIAVVGSGAWGTALACHAAKLDHTVEMWALEPEVVEEINAKHTNSIYLKDQELPKSIRASSDAAAVASRAETPRSRSRPRRRPGSGRRRVNSCFLTFRRRRSASWTGRSSTRRRGRRSLSSPDPSDYPSFAIRISRR